MVVEHLAWITVAARYVDLPCRRWERGHCYEQKDRGESGAKVEEKACVGEKSDGGVCRCRILACGQVAEELGFCASEKGCLLVYTLEAGDSIVLQLTLTTIATACNLPTHDTITPFADLGSSSRPYV